MLFGGKCALIPDQLKFLKSKGAKNFEVHMFYKDANVDNYEKFKTIIANSGMNCYCLHSPYEDENRLQLHLGCFTDNSPEKTMYSVKQTLLLADKLGIPNVITHLGGYSAHRFNKLKLREDQIKSEILAYDQIEELTDFIDENDIQANLCIENILSYSSDETTTACIGTRLGAHEFVARVNHPKIKSTLDICHALTDINIDFMAGLLNGMRIGDYIAIYASTVGIVHLNNLKGLGSKRDHSTPFVDGEDNELLRVILTKFKEYNYTCPITNEVNEPGYSEDVAYTNYREQIGLIKKLSKDLDINVEV